MAGKAYTVEMVRDKETKNATRFAEVVPDGQPPRIGTLYVQTWSVGKDAQKVRVTVEVL